MSNVKGNALGGFKRYITTRHGARGVARWLECLEPQDAAQVEGLILPHNWYPVRIWNGLVDRYVALYGDRDPQSFRLVADAIADVDLHSFFKVLLKAASPTMVLRRAGSLWERYFDVGTMEGTERAPNHFIIRLTAPRLPDRGPGAVTCAAGIPAWQERTLGLAGAKNARSTHTQCRFRGAVVCEFDVTWS
jgi:hypothetical protein